MSTLETRAKALIDDMIESLGDDFESMKQIVDALDDGECLAKMGVTDQELVEAAYTIATQGK